MALTDNIAAYWKLDNNGSGGVSLVDSTSGGYTLTNNGGVTLGTGKINGCGVFGGTGTSLSSALQVGTSCTFSAWFKSSATSPQYAQIIGNEFDNTGVGFTFLINNGGVGDLAVYSLGSLFQCTGTYNDGNWHHIVFSCSSNIASVYIDGVAQSGTLSADISTVGNIYIGNNNVYSGRDFNGSIDEVGVWSRALSSTEVTELYNSGSGLSYPFQSLDLYFNGAVDGSLGTLGNWWEDQSFTTPATSLPNGTNPVVISANVTSGTGSYASAIINSASIASGVSITASAITLNGTSSNAGTLVGTTTLNGSSVNSGTITGTATFNAGTSNNSSGVVSGNATFNGTLGNAGTVTGNAEFFDTTDNTGTVEGDAILRNSSSNAGGTIEGNATIYNPSANPIAGVVIGTETYLWPNGTGLWGGDVWIDGDIAFIIPQPSDVKSGVSYGPASSPYVGTYTVPQPTLPVVGDVRSGVEYGYNDELTGTLQEPTLPEIYDVRFGISYGYNNALTGTYSCGGGEATFRQTMLPRLLKLPFPIKL